MTYPLHGLSLAIAEETRLPASQCKALAILYAATAPVSPDALATALGTRSQRPGKLAAVVIAQLRASPYGDWITPANGKRQPYTLTREGRAAIAALDKATTP